MTPKYVVCPRCEGTGYVSKLGDFTREWVAEEFGPDAEEFIAEYTKPGGAYDEFCPECKGNRVVTAEQIEEYREQLEYEAERQAEIRAGC